jgi:hypothetical protein
MRPLFGSLFAFTLSFPGCFFQSAGPAPPVEAPVLAMSGPLVGLLAPDIVGEDLNGDVLRLRDYRGKVVVLDFWGHW